jgi:hypothetical protein
LAWASTPLLIDRKKDVDGRDKPGHDAEWKLLRGSCPAASFVVNARAD